MAKMNFYRVKEGQDKTFATGNEISLLQQSGCHITILRKATKEEYIEYVRSLGEEPTWVKRSD